MLVNSYAQELKCIVTVDKQAVPDVQDFIIDDIKNSFTTFLNDKKWTNDDFSPEERIQCNLYITITSIPDIGRYQATAQIQASRPVYGTGYETILLNFFDKDFSFDYTQSQPLFFNENTFNSNITSLLAFYAYVILAMDYDSFSKLGGAPYIEKARNTASIAQEAGGGWKPGDPNNRAALIENLNSQQMIPFREGIYTYHRVAMDNFLQKPEEARALIFDFLTTIKTINRLMPYAVLTKSFFQAKRDEMISIFSKAQPDMKNKVLPLLRELDPLNSERYMLIMKN